MRRLEGVADVRMDFDKATAYVQLKPGVSFDAEKLRGAIEGAGDKVRAFELRLRGPVERQDGTYYIRPAGVSQRFAVRGGALADKLASLVGRRVRARGTFVASDARLELQLLEVAP